MLLIPATIGYINTRVNYDILYYLPDDIETMKGQDILVEEFGTGAYSMFLCEGMENKDVASLKTRIEAVDHVSKVVWYDSFADISIPMEMLPEKIRSAFNSDHSTMMFIIFETTTSADETMAAIEDIRDLAGKQCFLSGMSAIVTDTKNLAESEVVIYVVIAVILSSIVLALTMESYLIPLLFLLSIGVAILYNMGTNFLTGDLLYYESLKCGTAAWRYYGLFDLPVAQLSGATGSTERRSSGGNGAGDCSYDQISGGEFHHHNCRIYRSVLYEFYAGHGFGHCHDKRRCIWCDLLCYRTSVHDHDFR